jgi:hypothetical protein
VSPGEPALDRWLRGAVLAPEARPVPIDRKDPLLAPQFRQSRARMGLYLQPGADPYRQTAVRWSAFAAPPGGIDFLRCVWMSHGMTGLPMELTEGINFVVLRVAPPPEAPVPPATAWVRTLLAAVVAAETADHRWRFDLPADLALDGPPRLFTSLGAPAVRDIVLGDDRADLLVGGGETLFFFYKKIEQYVSFWPDDAWLSPAARAALA